MFINAIFPDYKYGWYISAANREHTFVDEVTIEYSDWDYCIREILNGEIDSINDKFRLSVLRNGAKFKETKKTAQCRFSRSITSINKIEASKFR